jgi:hypothetical protein
VCALDNVRVEPGLGREYLATLAPMGRGDAHDDALARALLVCCGGEENPFPRLHNAPSELFTLRAPPFIFGSPPADVSEH